MALLVPEATRVTRIGLAGVPTEHYGSPGRLADDRCQFERNVRQNGEDPSKFAVALETLAVKAFGDIGLNTRTRLIHDRFNVNHPNCDLWRHLDRVISSTDIECGRDMPAPTNIETMLKCLHTGMLTQAPQQRPATALRDWSTVLCFSCGQYGHGVGRCPQLDIKFPFMLAGWSAEKIGDHYMMILPRLAAEQLRVGNGY